MAEAGGVLLPLARRILADVELAKMEMDTLAGVQRGKLRLGLIQTAGTEVDLIEVIGARSVGAIPASRSSRARPFPRQTFVMMPLYTGAEGMSDLSVELTLTEIAPRLWQTAVDNIRVM